MVRTCLGEFEFDAVLEREPVLGPSLLVLYCFIAGVTLLNLLIAVISRAWEDEVPHADEIGPCPSRSGKCSAPPAA